MSSSIASIVDFTTVVLAVTSRLNRVIPPIQIVLGTFGNLFNIIIFTRRSLRSNPCSTYFLFGSVNNFFAIYVALLTEYLKNSWSLDSSASNTVLCELRFFFTYASLYLVLWFTALASIDRFLSSSHKASFRRCSSISIARETIVCTTALILLMHVHILVVFQSQYNICPILSTTYYIFFNFFPLVLSCVIPITLMVFFGALMILNVRRSHVRVAPQVNDVRRERLRSNNRQMIIMLACQVLITALLSTPYGVVNLYYMILMNFVNVNISAFDWAIGRLLMNLFQLLYQTNPISGFYIYTLAGPKFRKEMKQCVRNGLRVILTIIGLHRCLTLRNAQELFDENQAGAIDRPLAFDGKRNTIHPI